MAMVGPWHFASFCAEQQLGRFRVEADMGRACAYTAWRVCHCERGEAAQAVAKGDCFVAELVIRHFGQDPLAPRQ